MRREVEPLKAQTLSKMLADMVEQASHRGEPMPFDGKMRWLVDSDTHREIGSAGNAFAALRAYRKDRRRTGALGDAALGFSISSNFGPERIRGRMLALKKWCDEELRRRGLAVGVFGNFRVSRHREVK